MQKQLHNWLALKPKFVSCRKLLAPKSLKFLSCPRGAVSSQVAEIIELNPPPAPQQPGNRLTLTELMQSSCWEWVLLHMWQLLCFVMQDETKNPNLPLSYSFPTFFLIAQYKSFEPSLNQIASQMTNNKKIGFITRNNERNHSLWYQELVGAKGALQSE